MIVSEQLRAEAKAMHQRGTSLEAIMYYLREQGLALGSAMSVVNGLLLEPPIAKTKELVRSSATWGDHKKAFWEFQKILWTAIDIADEGAKPAAKSV